MTHSSLKQRNLFYRAIATVGRGASRASVKYHWKGIEHLPQDGAFIVCPNHLTNADPIAVAYLLYANGYTPQFLAKGSLFKNKALGFILSKCGQIPVYRDTDPSAALRGARKVIDEGGVVVMYPEGTFTRDPKRWPMKGKTGSARLALETGAPIIPVAHWGLLDFMPIGTFKVKKGRPDVDMLVGEPLDLSQYQGQEITREVLQEVTVKIIDAITELLEQLRHEKAPQPRWDMAKDGTAIYDDEGNFVIDDISKDS